MEDISWLPPMFMFTIGWLKATLSLCIMAYSEGHDKNIHIDDMTKTFLLLPLSLSLDGPAIMQPHVVGW